MDDLQPTSIRDEWDQIFDRIEAKYAKLDEESCSQLPRLVLIPASQLKHRVGS